MKTQEQIIDEIQSLGDQIIFYEEKQSLDASREEFDQIINSHYNSLQKHIKSQITPKVQKKKIIKPQMIPKKRNQHLNLILNLSNHVKAQKAIQDKKISRLKQQIKVQKLIKPINKSAVNIVKPQQTIQPIIKTQKKPIKQVQKRVDHKSQLNYKKFVDRNLQKIITQLKKQKQSKQKLPKEKFNKDSKLNETSLNASKFKTNTKQDILSMTTRTKLNQSFQSVYTNSKNLIQRKQKKVEFLRQQKFKKQMQNGTFQPWKFTSRYKSSNALLKQQKNLNSYYKRLQKYNQSRVNNQLKNISEVMEECPFKPRLNIQTRNANSIIKSIWESPQKSMNRQLKNIKANRSIQRLNRSIYSSQRGSTIINPLQIPVSNTQQLNFLF